MSLCVSVCHPPPHPRLPATNFGTHMRIDSGIIRAQTNLTHPTPGGILGGKKFQKVREMSLTDQKINKKNEPPQWGGGLVVEVLG